MGLDLLQLMAPKPCYLIIPMIYKLPLHVLSHFSHLLALASVRTILPTSITSNWLTLTSLPNNSEVFHNPQTTLNDASGLLEPPAFSISFHHPDGTCSFVCLPDCELLTCTSSSIHLCAPRCRTRLSKHLLNTSLHSPSSKSSNALLCCLPQVFAPAMFPEARNIPSPHPISLTSTLRNQITHSFNPFKT